MANVELNRIHKSFGSVPVIDDLSLGINSKEFVVFLGPSGCGKSTLLRMIAGLEGIDRGEIRIGGHRVDHLPPGKRGVAMVFQHYALYPHMNIHENMAFGLRNIRMPADEIERRVSSAAELLEIVDYLDRRPGALSGGQRQRVAIGRAIVKEPDVFLFDEPLSNLDAALRVRMRFEIAQLHQRVKATMIFVTHDQTEAMTMADRIVVMNNRVIEQVGTPLEIYTRPASLFVAGFVGSPRMNFVDVSIRRSGDGMAEAHLPYGETITISIPADELSGENDFTLGVRPEAVSLMADDGSGVTGQVDVVEQLGDRTLVYVRARDGVTYAAVDEGLSDIRIGDGVAMQFDPDRIHLFDAQGRAHHSTASRPAGEAAPSRGGKDARMPSITPVSDP